MKTANNKAVFLYPFEGGERMDWKDRLKEEYAQTKERYEKLKAYNNKKEVEVYLSDLTESKEERYSNHLLSRQQSVMGEYLHILELRAELAHIEL